MENDEELSWSKDFYDHLKERLKTELNKALDGREPSLSPLQQVENILKQKYDHVLSERRQTNLSKNDKGEK